MRAGRSKWFWLLGLALIIGVAVLFLALLPRERRLIDRSTRIVSTNGWGLGRGTTDLSLLRTARRFGVGGSYSWVDTKTILFFRHLPQPFIKMMTNPNFSFYPQTLSEPVGGHPTLYNLTTKQERVVEGLARVFQKSHGEATIAEVSPDGQWLLWENNNSGYQIATLQGQRYFQWNEIGIACWTADSHHVIDVDTFQNPYNPFIIGILCLPSSAL